MTVTYYTTEGSHRAVFYEVLCAFRSSSSVGVSSSSSGSSNSGSSSSNGGSSSSNGGSNGDGSVVMMWCSSSSSSSNGNSGSSTFHNHDSVSIMSDVNDNDALEKQP